MQNVQNPTDKQLFKRIAQHNEEAIATLLDRYKNKFYTAIYVLVKDQYLCEDIFQEVCIKIINCIRDKKYKDDGKFLPWAMRLARNYTFDQMRKMKQKAQIVTIEGIDIFSVIDIKEPLQDTQQKISISQNLHQNITNTNKVDSWLMQLSYEQREVIVLRIYGKLSFAEIATLTNTSVNTALGRMRYGLLKLKQISGKQKMEV